VFILLCLPALGLLGGYYDELHQAVPSFTYLGQKPGLFAALTYHDYPLLNQSYSGAIKTAIWGLWMKSTSLPFDLGTWRLLGIVVVTGALVFFLRGLVNAFGSQCGFIFALLFITDAAILIEVRYDWGPVAFALAIRLILLRILFSIGLAPHRMRPLFFVYGFLLAISVFEKLSNVVSVIPFFILLTAVAPTKHRLRAIFVFSLGFGFGLIPLGVVNALSFSRSETFISLKSTQTNTVVKSLPEYAHLVRNIITLGSGASPRKQVLGTDAGSHPSAELLLMSALLVLIVLAPKRFNPPDRSSSLAFLPHIFLLSYIASVLGLLLLPQETKNIHWIICSPLHYVAIALCAERFFSSGSVASASLPWIRRVCGTLLLLLLSFRVTGLIDLEGRFVRGEHHGRWTPDLNEIAVFARAQPPTTLFLSLDWGAGAALACAVQGDMRFGVTPHMTMPREEDFRRLLSARLHVTDIYVVDTRVPLFADSSERKRRWSSLKEALDNQWVETPLSEMLSRLEGLEIMHLQRTPL
jgi:hypothetical protein